MIASTTSQGTVLVWHYPTPERWGAFAGGFEEVDENVVYEEREDEFDIVGSGSHGSLWTVGADGSRYRKMKVNWNGERRSRKSNSLISISRMTYPIPC